MIDVFMKILNMSLVASLLIFAVIILRFFLKKAPRKAVCFLWALVAIRLICPFALESRLSIIPNMQLINNFDGNVGGITDENKTDESESDGFIKDNFNPAESSVDKTTGNVLNDTNGVKDGEGFGNTIDINQDSIIDNPEAVSNIRDNTADDAQNSIDGTHTNQNIVENQNLAESQNIVKDTDGSNMNGVINEKKSISSGFVFTVVWLVGIAALLLYGIFSYIVLHKKTSVSMVMDFDMNSINGKNRANDAYMKNKVYLCDDISAPFILGVFSPRIYLPSTLKEADREYVISHEFAHLSRYDHWWKPLGYLILTLHWFNPFVWAAYILFCRDIEIACDEKVVSTADEVYKRLYAKTLLECSVRGKIITACPLAFGEVSVKERIKAVLSYKKPAFWVTIFSIIVCIGVSICFMTDPAPDKKPVMPNETVENETVENESKNESKNEGVNNTYNETISNQISESETQKEDSDIETMETGTKSDANVDITNKYDKFGNLLLNDNIDFEISQSNAYGESDLRYHNLIYSTYADLNHDGLYDLVQVVLHSNKKELYEFETKGNSMVNVYVYSGIGDGIYEKNSCFVSRDYGRKDGMEGIIDIVHKDGKDYLLLAEIVEELGKGSFSYKVVYLDTDKKYTDEAADNQSKNPCNIVVFDEYSGEYYDYMAACEDWPSKKHRAQLYTELKSNIEKWLKDDELLYGEISGQAALASTVDRKESADVFYDTFWNYQDTIVKYGYFEDAFGYEKGYYICHEDTSVESSFVQFYDMHGNIIETANIQEAMQKIDIDWMVKKIVVADDEDYDGDGKNDILYKVDKGWRSDYEWYIHLSSYEENESLISDIDKNDIYMGDFSSSYKLFVKAVDLTGNGENEIVVEYSFDGADNSHYSILACFVKKNSSDMDSSGRNEKYEAVDIEEFYNQSEFEIEWNRDQTKVEISRNDIDYSTVFWDEMFNLTSIINEGVGRETLRVSEVRIGEKDGKPVIIRKYQLGTNMNFVIFIEVLSFTDGKLKMIDFYLDDTY